MDSKKAKDRTLSELSRDSGGCPSHGTQFGVGVYSITATSNKIRHSSEDDDGIQSFPNISHNNQYNIKNY